MFAHLLDQHFEVYRRLGAAGVEGLGAEGIGFAVQFLHQEVQAATGLAAGFQHAAHFADVGAEAIQLFGDIAFLRQNHQLLLQALRVEFGLHLGAAVENLLALSGEHLWHQFAQGDDLFKNAIQALIEQLGQFAAFALAAVLQFVQGLGEQAQGALIQCLRVGGVSNQYTGPTEHFQWVESGGLLDQAGHAFGGGDQLGGTLQVDAYGGYSHLAKPDRKGGKPLALAFCWAHGRRKLIKAKPKKGSPIVDEALLRIAALYKIEDGIRGKAPDHRRAVRQKMSCPLVNAFFDWLSAQAARVSRKSKLGLALAYMLKRQSGFRLFLENGQVDIDSNLVENAIRSPAMNRRNALFAGHDEGGRNWARFASLIGTCKMNNVEPYAYLRDLFISIANGHPAKDIDALMPWAYTQRLIPSK